MDDLGCMTLDLPDGPVRRSTPRADVNLCNFQLNLPQDVFLLKSVNARTKFGQVVPATGFIEQNPRAGLIGQNVMKLVA
jgi:hypothetical protein